MNKRIKFLNIFLVFILCLCSIPTDLYAKNESQIIFGDIRVQAVGYSEPSIYRGCKDGNDKVYVHLDDLASIIGGKNQQVNDNFYRLSFGCWNMLIEVKEGIASVFYDPSKNGVGYNFIDSIKISKPIYHEEQNTWYLPFEEILYLAHSQWICAEQTVFVNIPETILDVAASLKVTRCMNPTYADFIGDDDLERLGNSVKYGLGAFLDELDTSLIFDSVLTTFGVKSMTSYEKDVMESAIMMLYSDMPIDGNQTLQTTSFENTQNFVQGLTYTVKLADEAEVLDKVTKMMGTKFTNKQIENFTKKFSLGSSIVNYALSVGQTIYMRDNMPQSFEARLKKLIEVSEEKLDIDFYKKINKVSTSIYKTYYEDIRNVYKKNLKFDEILNVVDDTLSLGGITTNVIVPLEIMDLSFTVFDYVSEGLKLLKPIKDILENPKNINVALNQIDISSLMYHEFEKALLSALIGTSGINAESLENIRICAQVSQSAALHARTELNKSGREIKKESITNQDYESIILTRLFNSQKYDQLLLMDEDFTDIHADKEGCVRMEIPSNYIMSLPVIDFSFRGKFKDLEVTPKYKGQEIPEGQKVTITSEVRNDFVYKYDYDYKIKTLIIHHETYGDYRYECDFYSSYGGFCGVDMGDGEYTYAITIHHMGTVGGEESIILKPINGKLQQIKNLNEDIIKDGFVFKGKFEDEDTLSVVIYPSKKAFVGEISSSSSERINRVPEAKPCGYLNYILNDQGYYDFVYKSVISGVLFNMDNIGACHSRYILKDGKLVIDDQWFEFY